MFNILEKAINGSPIEMYRFIRGTTNWFYTSSDTIQSYNGNEYVPTKLKRSRVKQGGGMSAEGITITLPRDNELALTYVAFPVADSSIVSIYSRHRNDTDAEVVHIWTGRVKNATFKGSVVELLCESILTAARSQGLKRNYGANCSHVLYDQTPLTCNVNKAVYQSVISITGVDGVLLSSTGLTGFADGYFAGGIVEWLHNGVTEYRMIMANWANTIRLISPLNNLAIGDTINLYPGCNRTLDHCQNRFNNIENYGGFPYVPLKSPFGGTMLY